MWEYFYTNEMYHHGIFGMKWGKKNGPPYPLKEGAHSASEKKAGWRKSLNNKADEDAKSNDYVNSRRTDINSMTNEELQSLVNRLNLEKRYKDLMKKDYQAGKNFLETSSKVMETLSKVSSSSLTLYDNYRKFKKMLNE